MTQWNGLSRTELQRRTRLKRGKGIPGSREPIPARGRRGKRLYRDAKAVYARVVEEETVCRKCGTAGEYGNPLEIHHLLPKSSGREQLEPTNLVRLCRVHHQWAHNNPIEAREQGWLRSRFERSKR